MITLFQIDKSGNEVFEKDYSIAIVVDRKHIYGFNMPQNIKDSLLNLFYSGQLEIKAKNKKINKTRFRIRAHTSIIVLLLKKIISQNKNINEACIQICNDIDGHFHEIREMIFAHISKLIPSLKKEDIIQARFSKTSSVDLAARNLRAHDKAANEYGIIKLSLKELTEIIKR